MNKVVLLIILSLLISGFVMPSAPRVDVYVCDCLDPVDNIRLCYCARENTVCGNYCVYFYWTKWEEVESYWYMCDGYGLYLPVILQGEVNDS